MARFDYPLLVTVIMLFPMLYFAFASLTFFLRRFDDPIVTWMLRGLFNVYFLVIATCCALGVAAFASAGRLSVALGLGALVACALAARWWFLGRMDAQLRARDAGDAQATRRLRRLHVGGILYNAVQVATVIVTLPPALGPLA